VKLELGNGGLLSREKEILWQVMEEGMKNVNQYIKDINLLIESGSYGHAFSLAVIAKEETIKVFSNFWVWSIWDLGQAKWRSNKWVSLLPKSHEVKIVIRDLVMEAVRKVKIKKVGDKTTVEIENNGKKLEIRGKARSRDIEEFLNVIVKPLVEKAVSRLIEGFKLAKKTQKLKEKGLYVDFKDGKISTPLSITQEKAIKQFEELKEDYNSLKEVINKHMSFPPHIRSMLAGMLFKLYEWQIGKE